MQRVSHSYMNLSDRYHKQRDTKKIKGDAVKKNKRGEARKIKGLQENIK